MYYDFIMRRWNTNGMELQSGRARGQKSNSPNKEKLRKAPQENSTDSLKN